MNLLPTEFLGGHIDGQRIAVPAAAETLVIRDGSVLRRYDRDEIHEGPAVRQVYRQTSVTFGSYQMPEPQAVDWVKAEPDEKLPSGGPLWVTILCVQDGSRSLGIFAGNDGRGAAFVKGIDVEDGRDYVVTHYAPMTINWPEPAGEG
jgi:hypothetical protein